MDGADPAGLAVENSVLRRQLLTLAAGAEQQQKEISRARSQRDAAASELRAAQVRIAGLERSAGEASASARRAADLEIELARAASVSEQQAAALVEAEKAVATVRSRMQDLSDAEAKLSEELRIAAAALRGASERSRRVAQALLPSYQGVAREVGRLPTPESAGADCTALAAGLNSALLLCEEVVRAKDDALCLMRQQLTEDAAAARAKSVRTVERERDAHEGTRKRLEREVLRLTDALAAERADREEDSRRAASRMAEVDRELREAVVAVEHLRGRLLAAERERDRSVGDLTAARVQLAAEAEAKGEATRLSEKERRGRLLAEQQFVSLKYLVSTSAAPEQAPPAPSPVAHLEHEEEEEPAADVLAQIDRLLADPLGPATLPAPLAPEGAGVGVRGSRNTRLCVPRQRGRAGPVGWTGP
eukprot:TRINITY_DN13883_c0_g1_i2.p1 TRINITY_DN13883_c0_g1~~TRINITY_DN13883_c0_g1_i2.p1  ORF type:complete len:440 (+),score=115.94 TRINITY_DN13883_c0_g1_i2:62-1321(+)